MSDCEKCYFYLNGGCKLGKKMEGYCEDFILNEDLPGDFMRREQYKNEDYMEEE